MKQILDSFDKAASVTARRLTADIRRTAVRKGWDKEVADNLAVKYDGGKFDVDIPEYYCEAALKL